jgi:predicted transcriptional regulator
LIHIHVISFQLMVFHKFMKTSLEIKKKLFDTNGTQNNHIFFVIL